jgi:hypothetical protein
LNSFSSAWNAAPRSTTTKQRVCISSWRTSGAIERGSPADVSACAFVSASVMATAPTRSVQRAMRSSPLAICTSMGPPPRVFSLAHASSPAATAMTTAPRRSVA